jgi:hypothetical protein
MINFWCATFYRSDWNPTVIFQALLRPVYLAIHIHWLASEHLHLTQWIMYLLSDIDMLLPLQASCSWIGCHRPLLHILSVKEWKIQDGGNEVLKYAIRSCSWGCCSMGYILSKIIEYQWKATKYSNYCTAVFKIKYKKFQVKVNILFIPCLVNPPTSKRGHLE